MTLASETSELAIRLSREERNNTNLGRKKKKKKKKERKIYTYLSAVRSIAISYKLY